MYTCNSIWLLKFVTYTPSGVGSHNLFPRVLPTRRGPCIEGRVSQRTKRPQLYCHGHFFMCNSNEKKVGKTQMFLPKWHEPLHLRDVKSEVIATDNYQILLEWTKGRKNKPFDSLFQVVIKTSHRISINTTGKSSFKLGNLPSLKMIHVQSERRYWYCHTKSHNFTDVCMVGGGGGGPGVGGGTNLPSTMSTTHTSVISRVWGTIPSFAINHLFIVAT